MIFPARPPDNWGALSGLRCSTPHRSRPWSSSAVRCRCTSLCKRGIMGLNPSTTAVDRSRRDWKSPRTAGNQREATRTESGDIRGRGGGGLWNPNIRVPKKKSLPSAHIISGTHPQCARMHLAGPPYALHVPSMQGPLCAFYAPSLWPLCVPCMRPLCTLYAPHTRPYVPLCTALCAPFVHTLFALYALSMRPLCA